MGNIASKVGVFHPGTQHSWQTARALCEASRLGWYATSIFYDAQKWPYKIERLLPQRIGALLNAEFMRFNYPALPSRYVHTFGLWEWAERISARAGKRRLAGSLNRYGNISFGKQVVKLMRESPVDILWGYDTSSLEVFSAARAHGQACILDKTIGDARVYNRIMAQAFDECPEFFKSPQFKISTDVIDRVDEEMDLATKIVVGSAACRDTILDADARPDLKGKIDVLSYGFDSAFFPPGSLERRSSRNGPVKFIFVGQVTPRKGVHMLLKAFLKIPKSAASLTLLGRLDIPPETFAKYRDRVSHYEVVPRAAVRTHLAESDCLILPSLFEGSAIVLGEALASGLGVIQSKNAGSGATPETGIVLEHLTERAVYEAVCSVLDDRNILEMWRSNSQIRAREFTFESYKSRVQNLVHSVNLS